MALLVAMFTLVLLSVIGLGLMYATNMETIINANYRDKQIAMYGAMSGSRKRGTVCSRRLLNAVADRHAHADESSGVLHHQSEQR